MNSLKTKYPVGRLMILIVFLFMGATLHAQTLSEKKEKRHDRLSMKEIDAFEAKDWHKLRKINRKLARLLPEHKGFFYCGYGITLEFYQGKVDEAIKLYQRAISRYSHSEWGYYRLGSVYYHQGIEILEQAVQLQDNQQYKILYVKALEIFKQAKPLFEKGLEYGEYNKAEFIEALNHIYRLLTSNDAFETNERSIDIPNRLPLFGKKEMTE